MTYLKIIKRYLLFTFFVVPTIFIQAQSDTIYTGNIRVRTQAQVNALSSTLSGKTVINGNLTMDYYLSNITDLTPLNNIVRVTGHLEIRRNRQLVNLTGLNSLQSIGGYFSVGNANKLTTLDFPELQSVGGYFFVSRANELTTLDFPELQSVGGYFLVSNANKLTTLDFPELQSIGEYFSMGNANKLTTLDFSALQTIGEDFNVNDKDRLTTLDFPELQSIGGYFRVEHNDQLTTLDFPDLDSIGGFFEVENNSILTTLGDFPALTSIGTGASYLSGYDIIDSASIRVEHNPRLSDCHTLTEFLPGGMHAVSGTVTINNNASVCNNQNTLTNTIYRGNINVTTQVEVNDLSNTLSGKTIIDGNLTIGSSSNISDLTPLSNITHITENIRIQQNEQLVHLNDLNNLQSIGEDFEVRDNDQLTTLDFPDLQSIGGYFRVIRNNTLTTLDNFSNLQSIGEYVWVRDNDRLTTLGNFSKLQSIEEYFSVIRNDILTDLGDFPALQTIGGYFNVNNNDTLTTLGDFSALQSIGGYFNVNNNNTLTTLGFFSALQSIGGYFRVWINPYLSTLGKFPELQSIGEYFQVYDNDRLTTLGNFSSLTSIGIGNDIYIPSMCGYRDNVSIVVESNPILSNCHVLTDFLSGGSHAVNGDIFINNNAISCNSQNEIKTRYFGNILVGTQKEIDDLNTTLTGKTIIVGNVTINNGRDITDLSPLSNIIHITGNAKIEANTLTNLIGLNNLQTIGENFTIKTNPYLSTLVNFPALQSIGGDFFVSNNATLTTLNNFPVLQSIGGKFDVFKNATLTTLGNFPVLRTIGKFFIADRNDQLTTLGNFPFLQSIEEHFWVYSNDQLTTLGDFPALMNIGIGEIHVPSLGEQRNNVSIVVENNDRLSTCCVLTEFLPGGTHAVSGDIFINDNAMGCNTESEINATTLTLTSSNETIAYNDTDSIAIDFIVGCGATGWTSAITYTPANANFITLSSEESTDQRGAITIIATPTENTGVERTATITLSATGSTASQTVVITQAGALPILTLNSSDMSLAHDATDEISIMFNVGGGATGWNAVSSESFITVTPANGVSGQNIMVTATPTINTSIEPRTATITLRTTGHEGTPASVSLTITQAAVPMITLTSHSNGDNISIAHDDTISKTLIFSLAGSATSTISNISYTPENANFITIQPQNNNEGTITLTPSVNTSAEPRTATITLSTTGHEGASASVSLTITQAAVPTITLTSHRNGDNISIAHDDTISKTLIFSLAGSATSTISNISYTPENANFITIQPQNNNEGTITLTPSANTSAEPRTATITLSTTGHEGASASVSLTITQASSIHTGNITVRSQAEVNALSTTLARKTIIDGNLTIGYSFGYPQSNITDLTPLSSITHITRTLSIEQNGQLVNLNDLNNLQSIGGDFYVSDNALLIQIGSFNSLTRIEGKFEIRENDSLTHTGYFPLLTYIKDRYLIFDNDKLEMANGLPKLDTLGQLQIIENRELRSLGSYPSLKHIRRYFTIGDGDNQNGGRPNPKLEDLGDFSNLRSIGSYFYIYDNDSLRSLGNFIRLESIGGFFGVVENNNLQSLGNFPALTSIGTGETHVPSLGERRDTVSIVVENNDRLSDCQVLTNFLSGGSHAVGVNIYINNNATGGGCSSQNDIKTRYHGDITVRSQAEVNALSTTLSDKAIIDGNLIMGYTDYGRSRSNITDLTPLSNITHITGDLIIRQNGQLVNLNDLNNLQSIGGDFYVSDNALLIQIGSFNSLTRIEGKFEIRENDSLTHTGYFPLLTYIKDRYLIFDNDKLEMANGLPKLDTLGQLQIIENRELRSLGSYPSLKHIRRYFTIGDGDNQNGGRPNPKLEDLGDFSNLRSIGSYFYIYDNDSLRSLGNFIRLESIGGFFGVVENNNLQSLGNFPALTSIGTGETHVPSLGERRDTVSIVVENNDRLSDCQVLTNFLSGGSHAVGVNIYINNNATGGGCSSQNDIKTRYHGDITVRSQAEVNALSTTLSDKAIIDGNLIMGYTDYGRSRSNITDLTPLSNITHITGDLIIRQNGQLVNLNDLNNLQSIGGDFYVSDNALLIQIGSFNSLTRIEGKFEIRENDSLTHTGYFPLLTYIKDRYLIFDNDKLEMANGLPKLDTLGQLQIIENRELRSLGSYPSLKHIRRYFTIGDGDNQNGGRPNPKLEDLGDFSNLRSIGSYFYIYDNDSLRSLGNFIRLESIGGFFGVVENNNLQSLGNFPALTSIGTGETHVPSLGEQRNNVSIVVENNDRLSTCCVLTEFLPGGNHAVNGQIFINDNAMGCNTESEINATTLILTSSNETIAYNDTDSIAIDFIVGCGATGWTSAITYTPANANFITLSSEESTDQRGAITIIATPTENTGVERTVTITLSATGSTASQTVVITQAGALPILTLNSSDMSLAHDATDEISIMFNVGGGATGWNAVSSESFITVTPASGVSGQNIMVIATPTINMGVERSATITFTTTGGTGTAITSTVTITQAGALPTLSLNSSNTTIAYDETDSIDIMFDVGGGATGWNAVSSESFITVTPENGVSGQNITVTATPTINMGIERSATITITTVGGTGIAASKTVTITQAGALPTLSLNSSDTTLAYNETGDIDIMFNVGGGATGWNAVSSESFITVTPANGVSGKNITVTATPTINMGIERSATITITTVGGTGIAASKTVTITQAGALPTLSLNSSDTTLAYNETGDINIMFNVGGGATGWNAVSSESFITVTPVNGVSGQNIMVRATPTINIGVERSATITFTTTGGTGTAITSTVTITQETAPHMLILNSSNTTIAYNETGDINIMFNVGGGATGWNAVSSESFITVTPASGVSGKNITVTATPTINMGIERSATITITTVGGTGIAASKTVTITQAGALPTLSLNSSDTTLAYNETGDINIMFNVGGGATGWNAVSSESFITVTPASGVSGKNITVTATPTINMGIERSATITITTVGGTGIAASKTVTITQAGALPTLSLNSSDTTLAYNETGDINIMFNVGGGATGWNAVSSESFITVTPANGVSGQNIMVIATPTINMGVERSATITITTVGGTGIAASKTVTITQAGALPTLSLNSSDTTLAYNETGDINIMFNVGGGATGWNAVSSESFITVTPASGVSGKNIMVRATPTINMGVERSATITFTTTGGTGTAITSTVTITQAGALPTLSLNSSNTTIAYDETDSIDIMFDVGGGATGWNAVSSESFITVTPASGVSGKNIMVSAILTINMGVERSATITFTTTGGTGTAITSTVTITQAGALPTLSLNSSDTTLAYDETGDINIMFDVGGGATGWNAVSSESFITVTPANGVSGQNITVTATPTINMGVERSATITFTTTGGTGTAITSTVTITQAGALPTLILNSSDTTLAYNETDSINIMFDVGGGATGWNAVSYESFITVTPANGVSGQNIMVRATPTINMGIERSATITITTVGGTGIAASKTVTITQAGALPTLSLNSSNTTIAYDETDSIDIMFDVGGGATGWNAVSYESFITVTPASGVSGKNITVTATPTINMGVERSATITFTTTGGTGTAITSTVTITQAGALPTLILNSSNTTIAYDETDSIDIMFDVGGGATGWNAVSYESFITVTPASGVSGQNITVTATPTINMGIERSATITITTVGGTGIAASKTVTITQAGALPTLSLNSSDTTLAYNETGDIDIMFNVGGGATGWNAVSSESFITVTPANGVSGQNITVIATPTINMGVERSATITFTTTGGTGTAITSTVTITQAGSLPTLSLNSSNTTIAYDETDSIDIMFDVGGGATGWNAVSSESFITVTPANGVSGQNITVTATPTINMGIERSATITITTVGGTGIAASKTVTITQAGALPTLSLNSSDTTLAYNETGDIDIMFNVGGGATGWNAVSSESFITVTPANGVSGQNITVIATPTINMGVERSATITFTTTGGTGTAITSTVTITQETAPHMLILNSSNTTIAYDETDSIDIMFDVGGGATGWNAVSSESFITVTPASGVSGKNIMVRATPTINMGVERSATITFTTTGGTGTAITSTVTITQAGALPTLSLNSSDTTLAYNETGDINIMFNVGGGATGWNAVSSESFITVTPASGVSGQNIMVRATPTINMGVERSATITFTTTGGTGTAITSTVTITQAGALPTLSLNSSDTTLAYNETGDINIMFNVGGGATGWNAVSSESFITVTPENGVSGQNITVIATPTINMGVERSATITFTTTGGTGTAITSTVTITQAGALPTLSLNSSNTTIAYDETDSIDIMFDVGGGATGWNAVSSESFITVTPANGVSGQNITVIATPTINMGVERSATITFTTTGGTGTAITSTVTITQAGALPTLSLNSSNTTIAYDETDSIDIMFDVGGGATGWNAVSSESFITVTPANGVSGKNIMVSAILTINMGVERSATITFTTTGGTGTAITSTVTITQETAPHMLILNSSNTTIAYDETDSIDIMFDVGGGATGWNAVSSESFITVTPASGVSGQNIVVKAIPTANTTIEPRTATITLRTTGHEGVPSNVSLTITQKNAPKIMLTSHTNGENISIAHDDTIPITLIFILGGSATSTMSNISYTPENADFITLQSENNNEGTRSITFTPSANTSAEPRTAIITLRTAGHEGASASVSLTITQASSIHTGNISVQTQEEVNALHSTLAGKIIIDGNLIIGHTSVSSQSNITDLSPLNNITHITRNLIIQQNGQLVNLNDLNNLQTIGGHFSVSDNNTLATFDFPVLQSIGRQFRVDSNRKLITLDFPDLQSIGGNFRLLYNNTLATLDFSDLQSIGGEFRLLGNDTLATLGNFSNLISIGVRNNVYIPSLDSSSNNVSIVVERNRSLSTCCVLTDFFSDGVNVGKIFINDNAMGCNTESEINATTLTLISSNDTIAYNDTDSIAINFNVGCGATGWTSAITYTPANANFITLSSTVGTDQTGTITLQATPSENTGVERTATITLSATGGTGVAITSTVTITQETAPQIMLTSRSNGDNIVINHNNTKSITLNFTLGGSATGWESEITYMPENANFITLQPENANFITLQSENNRTITITPSSVNTSTEPRTATITLRTTGHKGTPASVSLTITQAAADITITVSTQTEVDALRTTLEGKNRINGNLTIGYTYGPSRSDITDLSPLRNITHITGNLRIQRNGSLTNLDSINNLETIGGDFRMSNNDQLTRLGEFSALNSIGGDFSVNSNRELITLDFPLLQTIGGYFRVNNDTSLTTLGDFPLLQTIGGYFRVNNDTSLTTLGEFPALQSIGGYFSVENNDQLTTLGYFSALQTIEGYFSVNNDTSLTTLGYFPLLQTIGGYFRVNNDTSLTTLGDFPALQSIGGYFSVENNDQLTTLGNFLELQTIGGYFRVNYNDQLTSLEYFSALQSIEGYFSVESNDQLTTLGNFPALKTIGGYFSVNNDTSLTTLGNFLELTSIGIGRAYVPSLNEGRDNVSIVVEGNNNLATCCLLTDFFEEGRDSVTGDIYINNNLAGCENKSNIISTCEMIITQRSGEILSNNGTQQVFTLYPNPTTGTLTIEGVTGYLQMYIYDLVGREVMTYSLTPSKKTIDVSDLPSGMYVVTLQGEDKTWKEILMKK